MVERYPFKAAKQVVVSHGLPGAGWWVEVVAQRLRPAGVEVTPVGGVAATMESLERARPAVVVVDETTLSGAGWGLLRRIRRLDESLPCLLVLGRSEPRYLKQAMRLSVYSVFAEPVDANLMGRMLLRLVLADATIDACRRLNVWQGAGL